MKINYKKVDYKYMLTKDINIQTGIYPAFEIVIPGFVRLRSNGRLWISKGYSWDGCTCAPDMKRALPASAVHDALYQAMRLKLLALRYRKEVDKLFLRIMKNDKFKLAKLYYFGVRKFAGFAAKPEKEKIYTAP